MIRQKINLINGFCEKIKKKDNNIYTGWIEEILTDTPKPYEFVLPSYFKPYLDSGNFLLSVRFNVKWCLRLKSFGDTSGIPVICPINPTRTASFNIVIADNSVQIAKDYHDLKKNSEKAYFNSLWSFQYRPSEWKLYRGWLNFKQNEIGGGKFNWVRG
jgi:hypothetical protein